MNFIHPKDPDGGHIFMTIDTQENLDILLNLRRIIDALIQNQSVSLKSFDLPFSELLDAMIDLSVLTANAFEKGARVGYNKTPELQFKEDFFDPNEGTWVGLYDPLGNPVQVKRFYPNPQIRSPLLKKWFISLAEALVLIKHGTRSSNFMSELLRPFASSTSKLKESEYFFRKRRARRKGK
jgi:hypothetical protein